MIGDDTIASPKHCMACRLMLASCCCRAGEAPSQQEALAQQLREAEEMLGLAADEADSLDKVLQAVQATVQVLFSCTFCYCAQLHKACSRHLILTGMTENCLIHMPAYGGRPQQSSCRLIIIILVIPGGATPCGHFLLGETA